MRVKNDDDEKDCKSNKIALLVLKTRAASASASHQQPHHVVLSFAVHSLVALPLSSTVRLLMKQYCTVGYER